MRSEGLHVFLEPAGNGSCLFVGQLAEIIADEIKFVITNQTELITKPHGMKVTWNSWPMITRILGGILHHLFKKKSGIDISLNSILVPIAAVNSVARSVPERTAGPVRV